MDNLEKFELQEVFFKACNNNDYIKVQELLKNPEINPEPSLQPACEKGHVEIVKLLLADPRVDPAKGGKAICGASEFGQAEIVELLLQDPRVDPSICNQWPIRWACNGLHYDTVAFLLKDPRVDASNNANCPLEWTCVQLKNFTDLTNISRKQNGEGILKLLLQQERVLTSLTTPQKMRAKYNLTISHWKWASKILDKVGAEILAEHPTWAKYFEDLVAPEILQPYEHTLGEFDMF